jgi:hypothetical protein
MRRDVVTTPVEIQNKIIKRKMSFGLRDALLNFIAALKPRLRVRPHAERLARGQLAELYFWKFRKVFQYHSNSLNFFKFYFHFLGRREKGVNGVNPVPLAFRKSFEVFPIREFQK